MVYGLSRREALDLPTWEFEALYQYAIQHTHRQKLDSYQVMSIAAWGDSDARKAFLEEALIASGYKSREPVKSAELPTEEDLANKLGGMLGSMSAFSKIRKAEEVA